MLDYKACIQRGLIFHNKKQYRAAISEFRSIIYNIDIVNYLLLGRKNDIPKNVIVETYYNIGVCYKEWAESLIGSHDTEKIFGDAIEAFRQVLVLTTEHKNTSSNLVSIYSTLCNLHGEDPGYCISRLQDALFYDPYSPIVHYNLGFMFSKINRLEASIIHYRLAIKFCEGNTSLSKLCANAYYGLSCVYRSIKQWPEALYYSLGGAKLFPKDPDINNQLGVIYTEMRRTDLAKRCYEIAIANAKSHFISTDSKGILSDIYLNFGQMHSYNGDTSASIDCYNRSLEMNPKAILAFQNKIMNLNYITDSLEDKGWVLTQHKLINKLLPPRKIKLLPHSPPNEKIHLGFVSGDFVDHPVSFFIRGILETLDRNEFEIYLYSETVVDSGKLPKDTKFNLIKNKKSEDVFKLMHDDHRIDILFDLSGHTAFNRLDIFNYRCAPIQITWIGYPNTTGLENMDYRITDSVADPVGKVERYYTERLLRMPDCFLNYSTPIVPQLSQTPFLQNGFITFGCYNRLNKISDEVIRCWNSLLETIPNCRIRFKTKALLNKEVISKFLSHFGVNKNRIDIVECTTDHTKHLLSYNDIDIALDTFPYSGTTTSCEALLMGVPPFTLRDTTHNLHAQNVTCSLLHSSDLDFYICDTIDEMVKKCLQLTQRTRDEWNVSKEKIREHFLNGKVCDKENFTRDFVKLVKDLN